MLTLAGKTALVTGGSRGIGRAVCVLFGRLGARVAVAYARDEKAARGGRGRDRGRRAPRRSLSGPTSRRTARPSASSAKAEKALGPLDVLVANHGIWKRAPIDTMTPAEWDEMLRTNLTSVRALCAEAARRMAPRGSGTIVLVASTAGQRGEPFHSHYAATQGRRHRPHALARLRARPGGDTGQLRGPGLGADRHEPRGASRDADRRRHPQGHPPRPPRDAGGDRRPRSPSSPRTWPATCTARSSR